MREQLLVKIISVLMHASMGKRMPVLDEMSDQLENSCPRCGEGRLRGWDELTEEERLVASRMPEAVDYTPDERRSLHRWCTNCWYEETESAPCDA